MSRIVDAWIQHPTERMLGHEMFDTLRRWTGGGMPEGALPLDLTMDAMDEAGVEHAMLTAWYDPTGSLISNEEVAECVAAHPDRLTGAASVDLRDPVKAVHQLRHAVNDLGLRALRIIPWLWGLPPNDRHYYPLYVECVELGIPFCTQVGHTGPLRTSETGRPIPYLDDVALDFPELVIVGGHIGHPWTTEMIALTTKYPNVYIDTSAYVSHRYPAELVEYLKSKSGRRKVLFGSNWPMISPARALARLDEHGLDDEARELFLGGNASRIFGV